MLSFFLLVVAAMADASPPAVLPASIIPSTVLPAEHAYVVSVYVGAPPEELTLEVRFDASGVWVFRDQSIHSASHAMAHDGRESDVVYFGGVRKRVVVRRGVPPTLTSSRLCGSCDGVLGLHGDSDVWKWWPDFGRRATMRRTSNSISSPAACTRTVSTLRCARPRSFGRRGGCPSSAAVAASITAWQCLGRQGCVW